MRQHSIKTTYLIHKTIVENATIMAFLGNDESKVNLIQAPADANYPIVNIRRTGLSSERGDKDFIGDIVYFSVEVYSDKYEVAANIADEVRFAIEGWILEDENVRLENIEVTSATEDILSDSFNQTVNFKAEVVNPTKTQQLQS